MERYEFVQKQALPYEMKVRLAKRRAYEFCTEIEKMGKNVHVSVKHLSMQS